MKRKKLTLRFKRELAKLRAMPDSEIDTTDIPATTDWTGAERGRFDPFIGRVKIRNADKRKPDAIKSP